MDIHLKHEVDRVLSLGGEGGANQANELLVDYLAASGFVGSEALEAAMRRFPRHAFLPGIDLHRVYQDRAVATSLSDDGWFDSSCSTPSIVSLMIDALAPEAGSRVLEVGAGTGWTAALLAEMAPDVQVTTLEILPELAAETGKRLDELVPGRVELRCVDGSEGSAGPGPYDRIIFACGAATIPGEIVDLLVDGGRLVIPIGHFIHVFDKIEGRLEGRPIAIATFVAFRDGVPAERWQVVGRRGILIPEALADRAAELEPEAAEVVATLDLDSRQIESFFFWLSLREPDALFLVAGRDGGWGFGLIDQERGSAAALFCPGDFTFRHYRGRCEEASIAVWGEGEAGARLLAVGEEVARLGWPRLEELHEVIDGDRPDALIEARLGDRRWSIGTAAEPVS